MHEGFNLGPEDLDADAEAQKLNGFENAMAGANLWPSESQVPGFRTSVLKY